MELPTIQPKQENFLPLPTKDTEWRLEWLKKLGDPHCKPYTEQDRKVFEVARQSVQRTDRWLGPSGYFLITIIAGSITFLSTRIPGMYLAKDTKVDSVLASLTGVCSTVYSNICSMLFTGNFPNTSSNKQNADQNCLLKIKDRYDAIALFMLLQCTQGYKTNIQKYAQKIYIDRIKQELKAVSTQQDGVEEVVNFLEDTITYLNSMDTEEPKTSTNSALEYQLHTLNLPYGKHTRLSRIRSVSV